LAKTFLAAHHHHFSDPADRARGHSSDATGIADGPDGNYVGIVTPVADIEEAYDQP
jgi:hypothetical protein